SQPGGAAVEFTGSDPSAALSWPVEKDGTWLHFICLLEHVTAPTRGSLKDSRVHMEKTLMKTDIKMALPSGCYRRVVPHSGLDAKLFIGDTGSGVIDKDYRGNVDAVLFHFDKEKFEVKKVIGLICEWIFNLEIDEIQILDDKERGSGGFGSTTKN
uniref:dUTP diphosphatase n=1 Tax=Equus asinus asinus TaxID=83772 RepID=A0A8C4M882_EQUAS